MSEYRQLKHVESGRILVPRLRWCNSYLSKLRGFTFRRHLAEDEGLVLVEKKESRIGSGITMLFVFFDLGILWVNEEGEVVDLLVAKSWRSSYLPKSPARYVVEIHPDFVKQVSVGDHVEFTSIKA